MYLATFGEMSQSDQAVFLPYSFNTHVNYSHRDCLLSCYSQNPSKLTNWLIGLLLTHFTSMTHWPLQAKSMQTNFQVTLRNHIQRLNFAPSNFIIISEINIVNVFWKIHCKHKMLSGTTLFYLGTGKYSHHRIKTRSWTKSYWQIHGGNTWHIMERRGIYEQRWVKKQLRRLQGLRVQKGR